VLAGRRPGSGSMVLTFNVTILPPRGNGFASLASRSRSLERQTTPPLAPRISRSIYSENTSSSTGPGRGRPLLGRG
jgi:hypothetical protein